MKKITTTTGTVYFYDDAEGRLQRTVNVRPLESISWPEGVNPIDGEWRNITAMTEPVVGECIHAMFDHGHWLVSTPVVSIEEMH